MDEQFSYSLGIQRALSDGFLNNTSGRNNDSETWNGRLSFHWDGGTGTKATLGASFTSHELGAQPLVLRNQADFYARSVDEDEFTAIDQNQQFLKLEHETETGTITSITSRNDWDMNPNKLDIDLSNLPFDSNNPLAKMISTISQDQQLWSQELRFNHTTDNELSWTIGGYLSEEKIDGLATRDIAASAVLYTPPYFPFSVPTSYVLESENYAGFFIAEKTITKTDSLSLLLRYDHFEKSMIRTNMGAESHNESKDLHNRPGNVKWAHSPNNCTTDGLVFRYPE